MWQDFGRPDFMWMMWAVIDMTPSADRSTLERMAAGDGDALAELYDRHARVVYSLALRIVRDQRDAEEVVQDVFAQAWRQSGRYSAGRGSVIAWLMTLTKSRAVDRVRGRLARPDASADSEPIVEISDRAAPADEQLSLAARAAEVRTALSALPLLQRLALELAFYEGLTHMEIADRLEQPLGTVKTRIRQGLMKLREQLRGA
jgi:RNA polymerase sigma-70 factor, ECF subfamily